MKKHHRLAASTILLTAIGTSSLANAALVSRLGGLAYYDDVANLTWLADANAAAGSAYDTWAPGSGRMTWANANAWAASLNVAGVTGWRLPDTVDVGNDGATYTNIYQGMDFGYNITAHSELSNMFYNVLGNTGYYNTSGIATGCSTPDYCLTNTGPFSNLKSGIYWSATEYAISTANAWYFATDYGKQESYGKIYKQYAWAVHSGDVSAVPLPAAAWLFGSGLLGLVGVARRQR